MCSSDLMAAHGLRRYTSALEGDPVRMAHGLAHEFFAESATVKAGDAKGNDAPRAAHHAPAVPNDAPPREIECLVVEAERLVLQLDVVRLVRLLHGPLGEL